MKKREFWRSMHLCGDRAAAVYLARAQFWNSFCGAQYLGKSVIKRWARAGYAAAYSEPVDKTSAFIDKLESVIRLDEALAWGCWGPR